MTLLADLIGLAQPAKHLIIQLFPAGEAEAMYVIARRNILDFRETRMFEASRQHDVPDEAISS